MGIGGRGKRGCESPRFIRKRLPLAYRFHPCIGRLQDRRFSFIFFLTWNSRRKLAERWEAPETWILSRDERVRLSPVSLCISSLTPDFSFKHRALVRRPNAGKKKIRNGLNSNFLVALVTFYNNCKGHPSPWISPNFSLSTLDTSSWKPGVKDPYVFSVNLHTCTLGLQGANAKVILYSGKIPNKATKDVKFCTIAMEKRINVLLTDG